MQCFHMKFTLTPCIRFATEMMRTKKQKNKKHNEKKKIKIKQKIEQSLNTLTLKLKLTRTLINSTRKMFSQ